MEACLELPPALNLLGRGGDIAANGIGLDGHTIKGVTHAKEDDIHGKDHQHFI